jgi:hypothetical protein
MLHPCTSTRLFGACLHLAATAQHKCTARSLQTARSAKRKWDQPAPAAAAASDTAPIVSQFMQAAQQLSSLSHAAYQQQPPVSQPVYHEPQMQPSGFSQAYQQHPGSLGMQSVHSTPSSSFGMPNFNVPPGSMGMHSMPAGTPWQSDSAQQQQPWGMPGQAPGYPQYPQPGMGSMSMNQQMPGEIWLCRRTRMCSSQTCDRATIANASWRCAVC